MSHCQYWQTVGQFEEQEYLTNTGKEDEHLRKADEGEDFSTGKEAREDGAQ